MRFHTLDSFSTNQIYIIWKIEETSQYPSTQVYHSKWYHLISKLRIQLCLLWDRIWSFISRGYLRVIYRYTIQSNLKRDKKTYNTCTQNFRLTFQTLDQSNDPWICKHLGWNCLTLHEQNQPFDSTFEGKLLLNKQLLVFSSPSLHWSMIQADAILCEFVSLQTDHLTTIQC